MRTVVLLNEVGPTKKLEQLTNSNLEYIDFPKVGDMPVFIVHKGKRFDFLDQPTHESDHDNAELLRYKATQ